MFPLSPACSFFHSPTLLKLSLLFYSLFLFSLQREQVYYFPPFTEDEFLLMFIAFVLQSFFRVALSLCRFLFFVRETVETLRLSHISLSFTSSYKVSSKFQSSIFFLLFISDIATLFMFFYSACSFFALLVPFLPPKGTTLSL